MEDGVTFTRVRERALSGEDPRLAYMEWSLEADTPDQVEESEAADPGTWALSNPALGLRIMPDYIVAERRELDGRTFAVERLGVGDWPPIDGSGSQVIPIEKWDALKDDPAAEGARMLDPVSLALDVTPDRSKASIVAVGAREDGLAQVEVIEHRPGTAWIPDRLVELDERHEVLVVICDASGPAGSLVHTLEERGLNVEVVSAPDYAKAFGHILDTVENAQLRHLGGENLRSAVKGATKRPIGDGAYGWGRRHSMVDITPLVGATLALWGWEIHGGQNDWTFHF